MSSTAHEGLLHVFPEDDLFVIVPTYQPICRVPLAELASTLRELAQTDTAPKGEPPLRTERQQMITNICERISYSNKKTHCGGDHAVRFFR